MTPAWLRRTALASALLLLNALLTLVNIWPTPAVTWRGDVSIELAVCVLGLAALKQTTGRLPRSAINAVSVVWMILAIGRYADVTAPALYGRDINLYWDVRYVADVTGMLTRVAPTGLVLLVTLAAALALAALYALVRWGFLRVADSLEHAEERVTIACLSALVVLLFAAQTVSERVPRIPAFATAVTRTYAHQARLILQARAASHGEGVVPLSPSMEASLSNLKGADVLLIFIESYGAITYDRPELAARLAAGRQALGAAIADTQREVVSAFVESPTFGGSSWFAHISLLSGVEVRDPDTDAVLMTQQRDTLARTFARAGFKTIAWMPGLKQPWPEGSFYGFGEIDGAKRLAYSGPEFGWFAIPDQFSLARLDQQEIRREGRPPLFVFFPTLSTHTPFNPAPPYQPDWSRVLTDHAYDRPDVDRAMDKEIDWLDLGPSYGDAVDYVYTVLAGYLRLRADHDFVLILLGDHQPPALVSGQGAPWDVPVHIIVSRTAARQPILDHLQAHGFRAGLTPERKSIGHMHALLPVLLDAFGR